MESLCGWTIDPSPPGFPFNWERTNSKLLEDQNVDGPKHDHSDEKQSKYVSVVNEVMYFFISQDVPHFLGESLLGKELHDISRRYRFSER